MKVQKCAFCHNVIREYEYDEKLRENIIKSYRTICDDCVREKRFLYEEKIKERIMKRISVELKKASLGEEKRI